MALCIAPAARAATVDAGAGIVYTAATGEANHLKVTSSGLSFTFTDPGATLKPGAGCSASGAHEATCTAPLGSLPRLQIDTGDSDDSVDLSAVDSGTGCVPLSMTAGDGADVVTALGPSACEAADNSVSGGLGGDALSASATAATLNGEGGDDVLTGSSRADLLSAGSGDDLVDGRNGADSLDGGPGVDLLDYSRRTRAVVVDLASAGAVQGESGEGDTASDFEDAHGGLGDDALSGDSGPNSLAGDSGNDRLDGRAGADRLVGGPARDVADYSTRAESLNLAIGSSAVSGSSQDGPPGARDQIDPSTEALLAGSGNDTVTGDTGDNILDGGAGADRLIGGPGEDAADYSRRDSAVRLIDNGLPESGGPPDGPTGAGDTIDPDVEDLWGGAGADLLTGNPGSNLLDGGPGADVLVGGHGEDAADYSERSTPVVAVLDGTPNSGGEEDGPAGARDTISTDIEDLFGGAGADRLNGNSSRNYVAGLGGDDVIDVRDAGGDYGDCGDGYDIGWVMPNDIPASNCERIGAGPEQTGGGGGSDKTPAQVRISLLGHQTLKTVTASGLALHFTCSETCSLDVRVVLGRSEARRLGIRIGSPKLLVARGAVGRTGAGQGHFTLSLSRKSARRMRSAREVDLVVQLVGRDAAGNLTRVHRRLVLLPAKARLSRPRAARSAPGRLHRWG